MVFYRLEPRESSLRSMRPAGRDDDDKVTGRCTRGVIVGYIHGKSTSLPTHPRGM